MTPKRDDCGPLMVPAVAPMESTRPEARPAPSERQHRARQSKGRAAGKQPEPP